MGKPLPKQWLVSSQTVCLLKLLKPNKKATKKAIKNCDDCKRGHCQDWATQMDYKDDEFPKEKKCKIPEVLPCGEKYYKKEYGKLFKGAKGSCLPCQGLGIKHRKQLKHHFEVKQKKGNEKKKVKVNEKKKSRKVKQKKGKEKKVN